MGRDLTQEDVIKYSKIASIVIGVILVIAIAVSMVNKGRKIEVNLKVGDTYSIMNVEPDKSVDMNETDGVVSYTITSKREDGFTDFDITAQKAGKITIKVKDSAGNKYKYKVRVSE